jgi:hypothetical protein
MTLYPFLVLEVESMPWVLTFRNLTKWNPQVGSPHDLGARQQMLNW